MRRRSVIATMRSSPHGPVGSLERWDASPALPDGAVLCGAAAPGRGGSEAAIYSISWVVGDEALA
jgi:hypothetical protein